MSEKPDTLARSLILCAGVFFGAYVFMYALKFMPINSDFQFYMYETLDFLIAPVIGIVFSLVALIIEFLLDKLIYRPKYMQWYFVFGMFYPAVMVLLAGALIFLLVNPLSLRFILRSIANRGIDI